MEKHLELLERAKQQIALADHLIYTTYPIVNEQKLLIKILIEIHNSLENMINSIIQYNYLYKQITNNLFNLETFSKLSRKITNQEEINTIKEIFSLIEKHKQSKMEFVRKEKFVIMTNHLKIDTINIEKIKYYNQITKNIINKIKFN